MDSSTRIPIKKISSDLYCFRAPSSDEGLQLSIKQNGLLQPLCVIASQSGYQLIDGHRRLKVLRALGKKTVPVFILANLNPKTSLIAALTLNRAQDWKPIEQCFIIQKARETGMGTAEIQKNILPLIYLPPSAKILEQYELTGNLPKKIKHLIQSGDLPFQGSHWLARLEPNDLDHLTRFILPRLHLTASQLSHCGEWLFDLNKMTRKPLSQILRSLKLATGKKADRRLNTDHFYHFVRGLRYPKLAAQEKLFKALAGEWQSPVAGLAVKPPDYFEEEGFVLSARIRKPSDIEQLAQHLQSKKDEAKGLFDVTQ